MIAVTKLGNFSKTFCTTQAWFNLSIGKKTN